MDRKGDFQKQDVSKESKDGEKADVCLEVLDSVRTKIFLGVSVLK